jgi:demethylmenaquinone methyltransferase / 2-methoxy-6-polyprenyl-1,4-benzoquinol methylase
LVEQNALARNIFNGLSTSYDSVVERMTLYQDRAWKRRMLERLDLHEGVKVLDVGCGTGVLEERSQLATSDVIGVDITSGMVRLAQRKSLKPISMLGLADAEHLPFREDSFDVVVSCYVPKYCDTGNFVKEIGRVLKHGGRMVVYDFARPHGPLTPLLGYYIYGLLPALGRLAAPFDPALAFTCGVLPRLIRSTTWKEEMDKALEENDLSKQGEEDMTGGAVTLFWASKD